MEEMEKKDCTFKDGERPHGSEVCDSEACLICIDGKWVNKEDLESVGC